MINSVKTTRDAACPFRSFSVGVEHSCLFLSNKLGTCSERASARRERGSNPHPLPRMHWMDARALRRKDAFKGERPWGDTVCDPWISDRETVSKLRG
ncbi:hypothetical protein SLEP1_g59113 [Rubroshorea leprosula]|uniref:Uncharacterized protein n=2 Tax=rosids TaxID=71275 RepID=A0AAV5MRU1_9ROSI|nr:hypothetical protein SLEP1_g59113 [Rubroshorea leprosula]